MMKIEVEVNKSAYEFSQGLSKFVVVMMNEIKDNGGWSVTDDMPAIIASSVADLLPNMANVLTLGEEYAKDKKAFIQAMVIGMAEMAEIFTKEEAEIPEVTEAPKA